ncbi:MAG: leucine-rich repeat domain-containing protein [Eubacteriales bacterium]
MARLDLPENLTRIGDSAFYRCFDLEQIRFGSAIRSIGKAAFHSCRSLTKIDLGDTKITDLRESVFVFCSELRSAILPESLKTIETDAFKACTSLKTLIFFSDDVTIQSGALRDCSDLKYMIFTKGIPAKFEEALFGETGETADGRCYISRPGDHREMPIPFPTLYYTAAHAAEWAPNGETEWNGYPIEEISQNELNAILAEARGEPAPTPISTPAPTATAWPTSAQETKNTDGDAPFAVPLLIGVIVLVVAAIVIVCVRRKKEQ